jgi:hypothetical protein
LILKHPERMDKKGFGLFFIVIIFLVFSGKTKGRSRVYEIDLTTETVPAVRTGHLVQTSFNPEGV